MYLIDNKVEFAKIILLRLMIYHLMRLKYCYSKFL